MPIPTQCPACRVAVSVPDTARGRPVRCGQCGHVFVAAPVATVAAPPAPAPVRPAEQVQRQPVPPRPAAVPPVQPVSVPAPKPTRVWPLLLLGCFGLAGVSALVVGGGGLLWLALVRSHATQAAAEAAVAEAQADGQAQPLPGGPVQPAAAPEWPLAPAAAGDAGFRPVAAAPAGGGEERFFDLPEREEGRPALPGFAGSGAGGAPPAGPPIPPLPQPPVPPVGAMPGQAGRVALSGGRAERVRGRAGMAFQVEYRFVEGGPALGGAVRYVWIIETARGRGFRQTLRPGELRAQGTLSGRALGAVWFDAPYRTYLAVERLVPGRPGWQEERISDVLTFR
jgi:hypothetical protein